MTYEQECFQDKLLRSSNGMINKYLHIIFTPFKALESSENHHLTQLVAILFLMTAKRQLKHTVYWQKCELLSLLLNSALSIER